MSNVSCLATRAGKNTLGEPHAIAVKYCIMPLPAFSGARAAVGARLPSYRRT